MPVRAAYIMKTQESASDKRVRAGERDVTLLSDSLVYHLFVGVKYLYRCYHILLLFQVYLFLFLYSILHLTKQILFSYNNKCHTPCLSSLSLTQYFCHCRTLPLLTKCHSKEESTTPALYGLLCSLSHFLILLLKNHRKSICFDQ